ncbi:MAG TPA: TolC family protein [Burkholderiaceae bacterium]|nr:TolC family protein [Burkholderiaceae bacterium]
MNLGELHRAAEASDPRARELDLLRQQGALRDRNSAVLRLPSISVESQTQFQTDAPASPVTNAAGSPLFQAPKDTYDTFLRVDQRLFDPTVSRQVAVQRAQLAEDQSRVRTALYALRQQINDAFFAVALVDQRAGVLSAAISDLAARALEMDNRVKEGTAVFADFASIEASRIQRQQEEDELRSTRRAALERLATIVGRPIDPAAVPVLPDLAVPVSRARIDGTAAKGRPEFAQFARTRERLERQREAATAQAQPRLSAFGRVGYGKPGLNFIHDEFDTYSVGGIRPQWNAWSWRTPTRESEIARLQSDIVAAEEEAFARTLAQSNTTDLATIERLERTVESDARIIELRDAVERAARARLQEGVLTAAEYVSRQSELVQARFARALHEVELAQARARLLVTLGMEVP